MTYPSNVTHLPLLTPWFKALQPPTRSHPWHLSTPPSQRKRNWTSSHLHTWMRILIFLSRKDLSKLFVMNKSYFFCLIYTRRNLAWGSLSQRLAYGSSRNAKWHFWVARCYEILYILLLVESYGFVRITGGLHYGKLYHVQPTFQYLNIRNIQKTLGSGYLNMHNQDVPAIQDKFNSHTMNES